MMDLPALTHFLNALLMIGIPIGLGIFLTTRFKLGWRAWLIGGTVFILSQVVHIPFNSYLLNPFLQRISGHLPGVMANLPAYILLGLSAGIFEECARYGMYRWWLKDNRSWRMGILAGAGHGGFEAILLGALALIAFTNMMAYRSLDLSSLQVPPGQLELARQQIQAYWSAPWYASLLGAVERIFTIPIQITASVLVLRVFTHRPGREQPGWLFLAIAYHALIDAGALLIIGQWHAYLTEAALGLVAALSITMIFQLRQPDPPPVTEHIPTPPMVPAAFSAAPLEETSENLENSRFQ